MQVMTHVTGFNAYQMAIQSKSDIIQHLPADFPVNETMARTMFAQKQVSCPPLTVDKATVDTYHPPGWSYSTSVQSLRTLYAAKVPILAGTDSNGASNTTTASSGSVNIPIAFGAALHGELELLKEAGMPTVENLRAATSRPPYYFGLHDRGVIAPGRRADLLLIRGDPIANISNTRNIMRVWTAGIAYEAVAKP
jgi:imidazolonepropionase-like amidohydrolase